MTWEASKVSLIPPFSLQQSPHWYNSLWHIILTGMWSGDTSAAEQQRITAGVHEAGEVLRAFNPDSGCYQNEVDVYQNNHIQDFWGQANYDRLSSIKKEVE